MLDSDILGAYNEGLAHYNEKARKSLNVLLDRNGEIAGCNSFVPLEIRKYLPKGTRLSTMADLGRATEINPEFLRGFFSDTGLGLRTAGDSQRENDLLAKILAKQLGKRGITLRTPKVIYFDALDLKENKDSAYGLVYGLNERAKLGENIIDAPELMRDMKFRTMDKRGIPIEDKNGKRTCYTRKDGLSRFYLYRYSVLFSNDGDLADSSDDGRVVVVKEAKK